MPNPLSQKFGRFLKYLLCTLLIAYLCDWSFFEFRMIRGTAMGSVSVDEYLKTPLKGSKVEYDFLGTVEARCSRTAFPQYSASTWNPPCWWLERHKTRWQ